MDVILVIDPAVLALDTAFPGVRLTSVREAFCSRCCSPRIPAAPGADVSAFSSAIEGSPVRPNPHAARTRPTVRTRQMSLNPERLNDQCQYCPE